MDEEEYDYIRMLLGHDWASAMKAKKGIRKLWDLRLIANMFVFFKLSNAAKVYNVAICLHYEQ